MSKNIIADVDIENDIRKANKKLNSWFNKEKNKESACELFLIIADKYKLNGTYSKAGEYYLCAGKLYKTLGIENDFMVIQSYKKAAKVYSKIDPEKALDTYKLIMEIELDVNNLARLWVDVAKLHLSSNSVDQSIQAYIKASDFFEINDALTSSNENLRHAGELLVQHKEYKNAYDIYLRLLKNSTTNNIDKWNILMYIDNIILCECIIAMDSHNMNDDTINTIKQSQINYIDIYPQYENSEEAKLVLNSLDCYIDNNLENIKNIAQNYSKQYKNKMLTLVFFEKIITTFLNPADDADDVDLT